MPCFLFFYRIGQVLVLFFAFFFNHTPTTEIYTLSLHDALPISRRRVWRLDMLSSVRERVGFANERSEEHTSELQSRENRVCRLLLEKKKNNTSARLIGVAGGVYAYFLTFIDPLGMFYILASVLLFLSSVVGRHLHTFPTRRSSD